MLKLLRFMVLVSLEHLALGKQRALLNLQWTWRMFQLRRRRLLCLISHQVTPEKRNPRNENGQKKRRREEWKKEKQERREKRHSRDKRKRRKDKEKRKHDSDSD